VFPAQAGEHTVLLLAKHNLGAFFAPQKPGFAGLNHCRFAAMISRVLLRKTLHRIQAVYPYVRLSKIVNAHPQFNFLPRDGLHRRVVVPPALVRHPVPLDRFDFPPRPDVFFKAGRKPAPVFPVFLEHPFRRFAFYHSPVPNAAISC
jgi:hypothetical protein